MIIVVVEDLLFLSKIQQTAQMLGISIEAVAAAKVEERARATPVSALIVDLNHRSGGAVELVRALKAHSATRGIPITGFLSHVQEELAAAARAAGCDRVLARSAMTRQLPELLKALEHREPTATKGT
jgi:CheY-like chemotaxis protein